MQIIDGCYGLLSGGNIASQVAVQPGLLYDVTLNDKPHFELLLISTSGKQVN